MRQLVFTLLVIISPTFAGALTIESVQYYGPLGKRPDLQILSSTDIEVFDPVLAAYSEANKSLSIAYLTASTADIYNAVRENSHAYDLIMSSAMDLQMKLSNDGFAQPVSLPDSSIGPKWSKWQDKLFGFSLEPVGMVLSKAHFQKIEPPKDRRALVSFLRANQAYLRGRVVTYDVEASGAGFLFATQDARQSESYWRLAEVMGGLDTRLYCCSGQMLDKVQTGEALVAYNIIGSYAEKRSNVQDNLLLVYPQDYTHMLLRTVLVPTSSPRLQQARNFLIFLLSEIGQDFIENKTDMLALRSKELTKNRHFRPIRLDTGLLVYLDRLKKERFLEEWKQALIQ